MLTDRQANWNELIIPTKNGRGNNRKCITMQANFRPCDDARKIRDIVWNAHELQCRLNS